MSGRTKLAKVLGPQFVPGSSFMVRSPALPAERLSDASFDEGSLSEDERLWMMAAIKFSSPALFSELQRRESKGESKELPRSWGRYVARSAGRCTPFGLYAGVSTGTIGTATNFRLPPRESFRIRTNLDSEFANSISSRYNTERATSSSLWIYLNPTAYIAGNQVRLVAPKFGATRTRFHPQTISLSDVLRFCFEVVGERDVQVLELSSAIANSEDVLLADAKDYVGELLKCGLLLSRFSFPLIGETFEGRAGKIEDSTASEPSVYALSSTSDFDRVASMEELPAISAAARQYAHQLSLEDGPNPLSVSLQKPCENLSIPSHVAQEIARGASALVRLTPPHHDSYLAKFVDAFRMRFGEGRVPLLTALDLDLGVGGSLVGKGFASPLDTIQWRDFMSKQDVEESPSALSHQIHLYTKAIRNRTSEIRLTDSDIETMSTNGEANYPATAAVVCSLLATSAEAVDEGDYRIHLESVANDAASWLGRLIEDDDELTGTVREMRRRTETDPNTIYPEIVHPAALHKHSNILRRPQLGEHEVWVLGTSASTATRVSLRHLAVGISPAGATELWHLPTGKRVEPRLASAYVYSHPTNMHIFRFLAHCANQNRGDSLFHWAEPLARESFLPRVVWDRFILQPARWRVSTKGPIPSSKATVAKRTESGRSIALKHELPRFVGLWRDEGHVLPLDLQQDWALAELSDACAAKASKEVFVTETLCTPGQLIASSPEGLFRHEIVLPVYNRASANTPSKSSRRATQPYLQYPPGSEWLYVKIFGTPAVLYPLLRKQLRDLLTRAQEQGLCDKWFFVLYFDPEFHVRLRVHAVERKTETLQEWLSEICSTQMATGKIWDVQFCTYRPEVERYGGVASLKLCEDVFHADSIIAIEAIRVLHHDSIKHYTFLVHSICTLLEDFEYCPDDLSQRLRACSEEWRLELNIDPKIKHELGTMFRAQQHMLRNALTDDIENFEGPLGGLLAQRSERIRPVIKRIVGLHANGAMHASLDQIMWSVIHMSINRLAPSRPNYYEIVIYDLLARAVDSLKAQGKWPTNLNQTAL
jgi:thiopeptide-type bacteriocin biosynthesis protein